MDSFFKWNLMAIRNCLTREAQLERFTLIYLYYKYKILLAENIKCIIHTNNDYVKLAEFNKQNVSVKHFSTYECTHHVKILL